MTEPKGLSPYICIGKWAKPGITISNVLWRVCFGWVSFGICLFDLERLINFMTTNKVD